MPHGSWRGTHEKERLDGEQAFSASCRKSLAEICESREETSAQAYGTPIYVWQKGKVVA